MTTLHIDSTLRKDGSVTRRLTAKIVDRIGAQVIRRDLSDGLPVQSDAWLTAHWTPAEESSDDQKAMLAGSDELIAELKAADTIVIGVPIYNFSVSAGLKAWIDLVCRAGITFNYSPDGPVGLLQGKKAILAVASGGVPIGSPADFATGYMKQVLGFLGITDIEMIVAERVVPRGDEAIDEAMAQIEAL